MSDCWLYRILDWLRECVLLGAKPKSSNSNHLWQTASLKSNAPQTWSSSITCLENSSFWMEGPSFLRARSPVSLCHQVDMLLRWSRENTAVKTFTTTVNETEFIVVADYSSQRQLYRVTGWIKRFICNCRQNLDLAWNFAHTLLPSELEEAEGQAQSEEFPNGVKKSCLTQLTPTEDVNRLICVNGRLSKAESLPYDAKFPLLLSKEHPLTKLNMQDKH